ncbi:F-box/SPRY domain-containing protein 1 [Branchiostoma belcheri]|nr:F-box/SPRY domain-containing protein 1 [Branchiostoma belcheri]
MAAAKLPCRVLDVIFGCLDLPDLANCALVCKNWCQYLSDDNSDVWRLQCDCSRNIYIKPNGFTLHRNPVAQSTDGVRGKIGFNSGRHAWEVWWDGPLGTVAVVGIATKHAPMQCHGYVALLGSDDQSWGWNLVDNHLLHNGDSQGNFPQCNNAPKYQVGERIRVILDMDDNTLSFERGYEFLGVAFRGLPSVKLFPAVSAVYGNTEVCMVYLGPPLDG